MVDRVCLDFDRAVHGGHVLFARWTREAGPAWGRRIFVLYNFEFGNFDVLTNTILRHNHGSCDAFYYPHDSDSPPSQFSALRSLSRLLDHRVREHPPPTRTHDHATTASSTTSSSSHRGAPRPARLDTSAATRSMRCAAVCDRKADQLISTPQEKTHRWPRRASQ